jgi:hypothetical protein
MVEESNRKIDLRCPNRDFFKKYSNILDDDCKIILMRHGTSDMNEALSVDPDTKIKS